MLRKSRGWERKGQISLKTVSAGTGELSSPNAALLLTAAESWHHGRPQPQEPLLDGLC